MTTHPDVRSEVARHLITLFPPSIQESLLARADFLEEVGITLDADITLGPTNLSFRRSAFYDALRHVLDSVERSCVIVSKSGVQCALVLVTNDTGQFISLAAGEQSFALELPWAFYEAANERVQGFEAAVLRSGLRGDDVTLWRQRLISHPLTDSELDDLKDWLSMGPNNVIHAIRRELTSGSSDLSTLMPNDIRYYERLVRPVMEADCLIDFVSRTASEHIRSLLSLGCREGLSWSLIAVPQAQLSSLVSLDDFQRAEVESFFEWIVQRGDRFSQVAAGELALANPTKFPSLEGPLTRIVEELLDDDSEAVGGRLSLCSNLIVLLDGHISRTGLLRDKPPFWRRLAVIAQASLIERVFIELGPADFDFDEWRDQGRGQAFFMQSLADLRREPRWLPDFISSEQLKLEFLGRIRNAGLANQDQIKSERLREMICGEGENSLFKLLPFPQAFMAGPLEGGTPSTNPLPNEFLARLNSVPEGSILQASVFAGLVNSAFVFRLDVEHAKLAAKALRNAKHQLNLGENPEISFALLAGLASVAAASRVGELAEEVRVLTKVLAKRADVRIEADSRMRIGLIASAGHSDLQEWCSSVGRWFSDIAFDDIRPEAARALRSHLRLLCHSVPELWASCSRAEAALTAVAS